MNKGIKPQRAGQKRADARLKANRKRWMRRIGGQEILLGGGKTRDAIMRARVERWLRNNPGSPITSAPRHIREAGRAA